MSFATYSVMQFAVQCLKASHRGDNILVERQPFGFVDDLALAFPDKEMRMECKVGPVDWYSGKRPLGKTFSLEQSMGSLMGRSCDLTLVVSDKALRDELEATMPDDLVARVVTFPEVWLPDDIHQGDSWYTLLSILCDPIADLSVFANTSLHVRSAVVALRTRTSISRIMLRVSELSSRLTRTLVPNADLADWAELRLPTDCFILSSRGDTLFMNYPELGLWERLPFRYGTPQFLSFLQDMRTERPDTEYAVMETIWRPR